MSERTIFLGALDRDDLAERAAYLDAACAGDPALRQRIEQLLRSHEEAEAFLAVPAPEQLALADRSLPFLGPSSEPDALGRLDHYEVLEVVGWGGTGVVLKARDTKLQRVVAVKVLAPRLAASATARRLFIGEAQAAAAVRDDHVVAIHAVSDEGAAPYLVMEFIAGVTLQDRISQAGALELREILRVGAQVAKGLAAAHAQGLVHRDVKPANVLLENGVQRVKLTDFGLASAAAAALTPGGVIVGTPLYMSPEQARGEPTNHSSDLFSLGSVLYAMCSGRPPFRAANTAEVLRQVCEDSPPPLTEVNPTIPGWLSDAVARLHAKEACKRFGSAREVADLLSAHLAALQQSAGSSPDQAPEAGKVVPRPSPAPGWRTFLLLVISSLLALIAVLAALLWPWLRGVLDVGEGPEAPLDLRREDVPPAMLALAGGGDPAQAPPELAAVLGDGRFLLPKVGTPSWMGQSPDGKVLAAPLDEDVVLFDSLTGMVSRTLKGPGGRVVAVAFSRDGHSLAATTWYETFGGAVRVWDLQAGRELFAQSIPGQKVSGAVTFTADGKHLFTEGQERIHVWDTRSGREIHTQAIRPGGIGAMSLSPNGRRVAVSLYHGKCVKVFDWDGEKLAEVQTLSHRAEAAAVKYSPDGKYLATGDKQRFHLWDAKTLKLIRAVETPSEQLAFTPDGRTLLASRTTDVLRTVHPFTRWAVDSRDVLPPLSVEVTVVPDHAFHLLSSDGKVLYAAGKSKVTHLRAIDAETGKELFPRYGHVAPLRALAIHPSRNTLASAGEDHVVKLWDLASGRVRHSLAAHADAVCGLAFSPDGKRLASASQDGSVVIWDARSGHEIRRLKRGSRSFSRVQFSPDGNRLACGGEGGAVQVWEVATGKEGRPLPGHAGVVRGVAFNPGGTLLASCGEDRMVYLHDLVNGGSRKFAAPQGVNEVAFSPDGRSLAAAGDAPEAAVQIWDVESGEEMAGHGHKGHVRGLAFSPAAPLLATCAEDGAVVLWDLRGGVRRVHTIGPGPFGGGVGALAFTRDGRYLATANANGTVYLLRVEALPATTPDNSRP